MLRRCGLLSLTLLVACGGDRGQESTPPRATTADDEAPPTCTVPGTEGAHAVPLFIPPEGCSFSTSGSPSAPQVVHSAEELAAVRAISDAGMDIWGYIMFGFEEDTPDVFQGAIDTVLEYGVVCTSLTVLAPYPGTPMGRRLTKEGRVTSGDLLLYDQCNVVIQPRQMTSAQLQEGYDYVCATLAERCDFIHAARAMGLR